MSTKHKALFEYGRREEFQEKLVEWIGDVFYDILPELGYEVRDEQIYTSFQIADAICEKKIHFAEAGLGTGKTFAYLLPALAYARLTKKPVVIACASTALQEQLCGEQGDIATLSKKLNLNIDARMAKDSTEYICDVKVDEFKRGDSDLYSSNQEEIEQWLKQTKRGERSEMPEVPDAIWKKINWEEGLPCDTCLDRGYCKLMKAKEYYRQTEDIIVVEHELFFNDLWTRKEKIADGKVPILPEYSAVIFDEGHKILIPAAISAGAKLNYRDLKDMIETMEDIHGLRSNLLLTLSKIDELLDELFSKINAVAIRDLKTTRYSVLGDNELYKLAQVLQKEMDNLLVEFQIEQGLFMESIPATLIYGYELRIDNAMIALNNLKKVKSGDMIAWLDESGNEFYVVPRHIEEGLKKELYNKKIPVVLTSATLSNGGDFTYLSRSLGIDMKSSSSVGNSFELEDQVTIRLEELANDEFDKKVNLLLSEMNDNDGSSLVLVNSLEEVRLLKEALNKKIEEGFTANYPIYFEDDGERGYLIRKFKEETSSVLIGSNFFEGIDIPGESLTMVVLWSLPFPSTDPFIEVQRKEALNEGIVPELAVDYPAMALKLKQGCGRLIRTSEDYGQILILDKVIGQPYESLVIRALPEGNVIRK